MSRHRGVALLPLIEDVKRVLNKSWVKALLHQLHLHLFEGSRHLHDILDAKIIKRHHHSEHSSVCVCVNWNHLYPYKARSGI